MTAELTLLWEHHFLVGGSGGPCLVAFDAGGLVIAHAASSVSAFELATGERRYEHRGSILIGGLALSGRTLAVRDGFEAAAIVNLLDAETGSLRAEVLVEGQPTGLVSTTSGFAWHERREGEECLVKANAVTGATTVVRLPPGTTSALVAHHDQIVLRRLGEGIDGSELLLIGSTGELAWRKSWPNLAGVLAMTEDRVVALLSGGGKLEALAVAMSTGETCWRKPLAVGTRTVMTSTGRFLLCVTPRSSRLERVEISNGASSAPVWLPKMEEDVSLAMAERDDLLWLQCVGATSASLLQQVCVLDLKTGALVARARDGRAVCTTLCAARNIVVVNEEAAPFRAALRAYAHT